MSTRDRGRRRVLTSDERVLWSTVTQSIAPLRGTSPPLEEEAPEPPGEAAPPDPPPVARDQAHKNRHPRFRPSPRRRPWRRSTAA